VLYYTLFAMVKLNLVDSSVPSSKPTMPNGTPVKLKLSVSLHLFDTLALIYDSPYTLHKS